MGREVKRVALDFDWPLGMVWKGFVNPYHGQKCQFCDGTGMNPETKKISDDWYDFAGTGNRWCDNIAQDEVEALIAAGCLTDLTHKFIPGEGWIPIEPKPIVTAEMVNHWNKSAGTIGHDAINRWICVETRAKRLGVYGSCPTCQDGTVWFSPEVKKLSEEWEACEPPSGEGYQVWETVSEGSPVTPVFPTAEALVDYLVEYGDLWDQKRGEGGWSRENAENFVESTWAPSLIVNVGSKGTEIFEPRDGYKGE